MRNKSVSVIFTYYFSIDITSFLSKASQDILLTLPIFLLTRSLTPRACTVATASVVQRTRASACARRANQPAVASCCRRSVAPSPRAAVRPPPPHRHRNSAALGLSRRCPLLLCRHRKSKNMVSLLSSYIVITYDDI